MEVANNVSRMHSSSSKYTCFLAINLAKFRPNEISGEFIFNYMPLKRYCGENAGQLRGYFRMQEEVPNKLMQEYADFFFQDPSHSKSQDRHYRRGPD